MQTSAFTADTFEAVQATAFPNFNFWYGLKLLSGKELFACNRLAQHDLSVYCPTYRPAGDTRDRRLFPGYAFARLDLPRHFAILNQIPYFLGCLGTGRYALPVPESEIEAVRRVAEQQSAARWDGIAEGDRVTVKRGPLAGVEGRVLKWRGISHLIVSVQMLGRGVSAEIDAKDCQRWGRK